MMKIKVNVHIEITTSKKQSSIANIYINDELLGMITFDTYKTNDHAIYFLDHHENNVAEFYDYDILKVD
jgi:hypothetical protein